MTEFGLARRLKIEVDAAKRLLKDYFRGMPLVAKFIKATQEQAKRDGFVTTYLGRKRPLPDLESPDPKIAASALRKAVNSVVQGGAADVMKEGLVRLHEALPAIGARALITVHDQVIVEVPETVPPGEAIRIVREAMEIPVEGWCRLAVDAKVGPRWGVEDEERMKEVKAMPAAVPESPATPPPAAVVRQEPRIPSFAKMVAPCALVELPTLDREAGAAIRDLICSCRPLEVGGYRLYITTRVKGREILVEAGSEVAIEDRFAEYLDRLFPQAVLKLFRTEEEVAAWAR